MSLPLPDPGVTPGPQWAQTINDALTIVDTHSHVAGEGVPITPAAMTINDHLTMNGFDLAAVNSLLLVDREEDITDRGVYAKDGNLFYRNTDGDAVQITNGDTIAGATGSITGLVSPAGAVFSSFTNAFSWTYDSNKHAKSAHGDLQLFPYDGSTAYTKSITVKSPVGLEAGTSYSMTLPVALPPSTEVLTISSSGVLDHASIAGTTNQVNVSAGAGSIVLSLPQNIHSGAVPSFLGVDLSTNGITFGPSPTTITPTSATINGPVAATSLNTGGGGAFKVRIFTGSVAGSGGTSGALTVSGTVVGVSGIYDNTWPMGVDDTKGVPYFNVGANSSSVRIDNPGIGTKAYRAIVFYT